MSNIQKQEDSSEENRRRTGKSPKNNRQRQDDSPENSGQSDSESLGDNRQRYRKLPKSNRQIQDDSPEDSGQIDNESLGDNRQRYRKSPNNNRQRQDDSPEDSGQSDDESRGDNRQSYDESKINNIHRHDDSPEDNRRSYDESPEDNKRTAYKKDSGRRQKVSSERKQDKNLLDISDSDSEDDQKSGSPRDTVQKLKNIKANDNRCKIGSPYKNDARCRPKNLSDASDLSSEEDQNSESSRVTDEQLINTMDNEDCDVDYIDQYKPKTSKLRTDDYTSKDEENESRNVKQRCHCNKETLKSYKEIENEREFSPIDLVDALSNSEHFRLHIYKILDKHDLKPSVIKSILSQNKGSFEFDGKYIQLHPKISICKRHSLNGCYEKNDCDSLHICKLFVKGRCKNKLCSHGHSLHDEHNDKILKYFHVNKLPTKDILYLITSDPYYTHLDYTFCDKRSNENTRDPEPKRFNKTTKANTKICQEYNNDICRNKQCSSLHICKEYLKNKKGCSLKKCRLNHDILEPTCMKLLSRAGISTNESPRDILAIVSELIGLHIDDNRGMCGNSRNNSPKNSYDSKPRSGRPRSVERYHRKSSPENVSRQSRIPRSAGRNYRNSYSENVKPKSEKRRSPKRYNRSSSLENVIPKTQRPRSAKRYHRNNSPENVKPKSGRPKSPSRYRRNSSPDTIKRNYFSEGTSSKKYNVSASNSIQANQRSKQTICARDPYGDTQCAEICYYSVESKCKYEDVGCTRLHSVNHFHWQISKKGKTWVNLFIQQILQLEKLYCDVNENDVDLDDIDLSKDERHNVLFQLLGKDSWTADFDDMALSNSNNNIQLQIRRICSERIAGSEKESNTYVWYFEDENKKWIPYGKVDSTGRDFLKSQINSNDIERAYRRNGLKGTMKFTNAMFQYLIDFDQMLQINVNTNSKRDIQRRPVLDSNVQNKGFLGKISQLWWGQK